MNKINGSLLTPLKFVAFLWLIKLIETAFGISFAYFGIIPRTQSGLLGILFAPLIHGNFFHLISNSIPLLVLGTALFLLYREAAYRVFFYSYFITNALVWAFAFNSYSVHIGASGLVYGIAAFLMTLGLFKKDLKSLAVSIVVAFFYSGIIFGVLPIQPGVSWESHLMGALVGIGSASAYSKKRLDSSSNRGEIDIQ